MEKKIIIKLGEKEAICFYGNNWWFKHFHELTGRDPLLGEFGITEGIGAIDTHINILYAGYLANASTQRTNAEITRVDFEHYFYSLTPAELADVFKNIWSVISEGEGKPPTVAAEEPPLVGGS